MHGLDRSRCTVRPAAAVLLLAGALSCAAPAMAQRLLFQQSIQVEGDPGIDLGNGDEFQAGGALLARADATWVVGRRDDPGEDELYVKRIAPNGATLLERTLDLGGVDFGVSVAAAAANDVYIAARSTQGGTTRALLLRMAPDGRIVWRFDLPNPGLWRSLVSDLALANVDGDSLVLGSSALAVGSETQLVQLARIEDRGTFAELGWQSTLEAGPSGHGSFGLALSPDGGRIAIGADAIDGFVRRPFLALVNSANGAVVASSVAAEAVITLLAPRFAADGSVRQVVESSTTRGVRLLRYSAAGTLLGGTDSTCGAFVCRPNSLAITTDGATVVSAQNFDTNAALLYRFAADGTQQWVRSYVVSEANQIPALLPAGTAVDIVVSSRLESDTTLTERWAPGRVDAAGQPANADGFPRLDVDGAQVVTMARAPDGGIWVAGRVWRDRGSIRVGRLSPGSAGLDLLVAPQIQPLPVQQSGSARLLQLDPAGRPTVAFEIEANGLRSVGARGHGADGSPRWSLLSDPTLRERSPALTVDPAGRIGLASVAGAQPAQQLALRRLDAAGAPLAPAAFLGESGAITPFAAAASDGSRAVATGTIAGDIVVRLIGPDGVQRWRTAIATGTTFPFVTGLAFLADGDVVVLASIDSGNGRSLRVQRLARANGSPGSQVLVPFNDFVNVVSLLASGQRVYAAIQADVTQLSAFDFGGGTSFTIPFGSAAESTLSDLALSADGTRLYAAGTVTGSVPRPRLVARNAATGAQIFDRVVTDGAPGAGRAVLLRGDSAVLVAERTPDPARGSVGAELLAIAADGSVTSRASINAGPRLLLREARYDAATDRAFLLGSTIAPDGTLAPSVLGVAFDAPPRIFADGFE